MCYSVTNITAAETKTRRKDEGVVRLGEELQRLLSQTSRTQSDQRVLQGESGGERCYCYQHGNREAKKCTYSVRCTLSWSQKQQSLKDVVIN